MYQVIDVMRGEKIDSEHDDFDDALEAAEELACEQAEDDDRVDSDTIGSFETGDNPRTSPRGNWEAGAGPGGSDCAYWPHVEWAE